MRGEICKFAEVHNLSWYKNDKLTFGSGFIEIYGKYEVHNLSWEGKIVACLQFFPWPDLHHYHMESIFLNRQKLLVKLAL